jgi:hypothetical protein
MLPLRTSPLSTAGAFFAQEGTRPLPQIQYFQSEWVTIRRLPCSSFVRRTRGWLQFLVETRRAPLVEAENFELPPKRRSPGETERD